MARLFISYSRADRQFVDEFVPLLRKVYGKDSIWFDDDIPGGHQWSQLILTEIGKCDLFIYLLSNEALTSAYCQAEFREALRLQKLFLPVIVRSKTQIGDSVPEDLRDALRSTQWVDLSRGFKDYHANAALYAAINQLLAIVPTQAPEPLMPKPVSEQDVSDKPNRQFRLTEPRAIMIAAIIGLIGVLAAVLISASSNQTSIATFTPSIEIGISFTESPTPEPTLVSSSTPMPTDTATVTIAPTVMLTPSVTLTIALSNTPILLGASDNPVTSNAQWTPQIQTFHGVEMVFVPAGCFMMGSEYDEDDERPVHQQCFSEPFWIDRYEVTNAQFGSTGCEEWSSQPEQPRNCLTWFEARDHCVQRGARLPTEAEWEHAARGPDSLVYPWGNDFVADNAVYGENSGDETAAVGSRPSGVSWVGAFDMSGNVQEWVSTIYDNFDHTGEFPYPYDPNDGREDLSRTSVLRVLRGGMFGDIEYSLRAADRNWDDPGDGRGSIGFRCALSQ